MASLDMLHGEKINTLSTKFFYKHNQLCYQIMVSYGDYPYLLYKNFEQYNEYKTTHDWLIEALNQNQAIPNVFYRANGHNEHA